MPYECSFCGECPCCCEQHEQDKILKENVALRAVARAARNNQEVISAIPWRTRYTNGDINFIECTQTMFRTWMISTSTELDVALANLDELKD